MIKTELEAKRPVKITMKYFISLPQQEAHSGHPTGQAGVYAQKLHPTISQKIVDMVEAGVTDTSEIKHSLKHYVDKYLSKELGRKPHLGDRAFYPRTYAIMSARPKEHWSCQSMTKKTYA